MSKKNYDKLIKLLLLGESGVGKTSLLLRFTEDYFTSEHLTSIGIDYKIKMLEMDNKIVKLQIWDTAGEERFRTITKTYYKEAHGILLVYDLSDFNSFKSITNWIKQIEENSDPNVSKVLIGNKSDLEKREVSNEQGRQLADEFNMIFFETSAKDDLNVKDTFDYITKKILKDYQNSRIKSKLTLDNPEVKSKKGCCK